MIADRFENPAAFQVLWLIPIVAGVSWYLAKRGRKKLADTLSAKLLPLLTASVSHTRRRLKLVLQLVVIALFAVALARPQSGASVQKVKSEGIEVMLLVDVSNSMLAEDVRPSRLELAKKELSRLIDKMGSDRIGLVAFAGSAVTLSPLTQDKAALKMFLDSLAPNAVSAQGTDFRRALIEAKGAFERGGVDVGDDAAVTRVVLLVSDGEDNEAGAQEMVEELKSAGIRVYGVAVGTAQGGSIPLRDERGNLIGSLRDKNGREVITKVVDDSLQEIARQGRGQFFHLTFGGEAVAEIARDFDRLKKAQFDNSEITSYNEDYQPYLLLAIILALVELAIDERRRPGRLWRGRFEAAKS